MPGVLVRKATICALFILLGFALPPSTIAQAVNGDSQRAAQKEWKKHLKQQQKAQKKEWKKAQTNWKKQHQVGGQ